MLLAVIRLAVPASKTNVIVAVQAGYIASIVKGTLKFAAKFTDIRCLREKSEFVLTVVLVGHILWI
jgi:hypothetical protein